MCSSTTPFSTKKDLQDGSQLICFTYALLRQKNTSALEVGGSLPVVDMACIGSVVWRFGGLIAAEKTEVTPEFEIEAYLRPCQ
jgi:hypothetical protein